MELNEQKLRLTQFAVDNAPDAIFWLDHEGRFVYANNATCSRLGYSREELQRLAITDIDPNFPKSTWHVHWQRVRKMQVRLFETQHRTRHGDLIPVVINSYYINFAGSEFICVYAHDISNRKTAEDKLKRLGMIIEATDDLVSFSSAEGIILYMNQGGCRLLGWKDNQIRLGTMIQHLHPAWAYKLIREHGLPTAQEHGSWNGETAVVSADGEEIPVSQAIMGHKNAETGKFEYFSTIMRDLRPQKAAAAVLKAKNELLDVTLRSIGDGVITTDDRGNVTYMNRVAEEMTGWTLPQAEGKPLLDIFCLINEISKEKLPDPLPEIMAKRGLIELPGSAELMPRSGGTRAIAGTGVHLHTADDRSFGAVLVFQDVSGRREREELELRHQKLEAIGVLAGGIAHDFNNLLTGIMANASIGKLKTSSDSEIFNVFEGIEHASMRARDLTGQLLAFAKGGAPIRKPIDTQSVVERAASFALRGSNTRLRTDIGAGLWMLDADQGQINQVISNLVINAQQAMPAGGEIRITCENVTLDRNSPLPLPPGDYLRICVADSGIGIPSEHLTRIFDPYFSTKQKGSGLGLATIYTIIERHKGLITVKSNIGEGTSFTIHLPAAAMQVQQIEISPEKCLNLENAKILIMDDEPIILQTMGRLFRNLGCLAEFATNSADAIELYCKAGVEGRSFDAVIMDLTIPGGPGGVDTLRELRKFDPQIKAIVSSGYSNDPVMASYKDYGFCAVLEKPYLMKQVYAVLEKVLSKKS